VEKLDMSKRHETLPLNGAKRQLLDDYVARATYQSPSLGDPETIVLLASITILALCIVGSFVYLIRSMVPA
jgi:hypothetical protein